MIMVEFRRAKEHTQRLSIAPLVDIVFLLLIFFLLSSSFQNPAIQLTLPEAQSESYQEKQSITITLNRLGQLYINEEEVTIETFPERLHQLMAEAGNREVLFRGDKSVSYEQVLQIMGLAKKAGAEYIDLAHRSQQ